MYGKSVEKSSQGAVGKVPSTGIIAESEETYQTITQPRPVDRRKKRCLSNGIERPNILKTTKAINEFL